MVLLTMPLLLKSLALIVLIGLVPTHAAEPPAQSQNSIHINTLVTGAPQTFPAFLALADGTTAVLYETQDHRIAFEHAGKTQLLDAHAPVHGGNRFQLHQVGQNLYASWWSHKDQKNLYITRSTDNGKTFGPVAIINDDHGVLPPYTLSFGRDGIVNATYLDERVNRFAVFTNRSTDFGQNWPRPDTRIDTPAPAGQPSYALEPITVQAENTWITLWDDAQKGLGDKAIYHVMASESKDQGKTWSEPKLLFSAFKQISALTAKANGKNVLVGFDAYQEGVHVLSSSDAGATWHTSQAIVGSEQKSNSSIIIALTDKSGFLTWNQQAPNQKATIQFGRFDLATASWAGNEQRIDVKKFDNTKSTLQALYAFNNGPVVIAWADYRDIKPNIYLSMSTDEGATWEKPKPYQLPGETNLGLPQLLLWGDELALAYQSYPDDSLLKGDFFVQKLGITAASKQLPDFVKAPAFSEKEKRDKLVARVNALWKFRTEGNFDKAYDFFDYAYKVSTTKKQYLDFAGNVNYYEPKLVSEKIEGNVAQVSMEYSYDTKPFTLPDGKTQQFKKTSVTADTTWVWVKDNWYLEFKPLMGPAPLVY